MDSATEPPFSRVWEFVPAPGHEAAFERVYGPDGPWAELFARALGYLGTELVPRGDDSGAYRTIDRWESEAAWVVFQRKHADAYEALDRGCEDLTISERLIWEGEGDAPG